MMHECCVANRLSIIAKVSSGEISRMGRTQRRCLSYGLLGKLGDVRRAFNMASKPIAGVIQGAMGS